MSIYEDFSNRYLKPKEPIGVTSENPEGVQLPESLFAQRMTFVQAEISAAMQQERLFWSTLRGYMYDRVANAVRGLLRPLGILTVIAVLLMDVVLFTYHFNDMKATGAVASQAYGAIHNRNPGYFGVNDGLNGGVGQ